VAIILVWLLFLTAILSWPRYASSAQLTRRAAPAEIGWVTLLIPFLCTIFLFAVLRRYAASDVRNDEQMILFYSGLGIVWVYACEFVSRFMGISVILDVVERKNPAALWATTGCMTGTTCCYAGANIGNGPGVAAVLFCAVLSTGTLFLLWFIIESACAGRLHDSITVERDIATGVRLGAYLLSLGIILGAAVAGDWVSLSATITGFVGYSWPSIYLIVPAAIFERPKRSAPVELPGSLLFAGICLASAAGYVAYRGLQ